MNILVTGAAGFIGSNFVEYYVNKYKDDKIIVADLLTYAGNLDNLNKVKNKIDFNIINVCDNKAVESLFINKNIQGVIHFAAESHVDNSIMNPYIFTNTNVLGTHILLETARKYWGENSNNKFVHISTDEVYGSLDDKGYFTEISSIKPSSPYSSSKASSDLIALSYYKTYGMNINVTNCSNNYGPKQHKEKFIPHIIELALKNKNIPVYGTGNNIRDWLYVEDHCEAIDLVFHNGRPGERYNIGGNNEKTNIEIVKLILNQLNKSEDLITFVEDRKGHDYRYAIDFTKIKNELRWQPKTNFETGLIKTIKWYQNNFIP